MERPLVAEYFLSQDQCDFDDEGANPFQQDDNGSQLGKIRRMLEAPDFRFGKDAKVILVSRIFSFGLRLIGEIGSTPRREAERNALSF